MAYYPPNFNLLMDAWLPGNTPATTPADYVDIPCQYYVNPRTTQSQGFAGTPSSRLQIFVRQPAAGLQLPLGSIVVPHSPGTEFLITVALIHMHTGFPNEYLANVCFMCRANGTLL